MRKRTLKIVTGFAVALVVLGVLYAIAVSLSAAKLRRAYAALEEAGRPMHAEDVIPAAVPETQNAALLYESAYLLLKAQPYGEGNLLGRLGNWKRSRRDTPDPNEPAETRRLLGLDVVEQAVSIVKQGSLRPACRFERQYEAGLEMVMPNLLDLKGLSRILREKALLEAEAGNTEEAWALLETQLRLANAPRQEPDLVPQMVRIAMIAASCTTARELCETALPDTQCQDRIEKLLIAYDDISPLARAVDGERLLYGEWVFALSRDELYRVTQQWSSSYIPEMFHRVSFWRMMFKPAFLADHAAYLRVMLEAAQQFEGPYVPEEVIARDMELFEVQKHHKLTALFAPATLRVKEIYLRAAADMRITRAGLALLRYRETNGTLPDALDALGLEGLADPFVEQSQLLYKKTADGFVVYSVGTDQKDNDGTPRPPKGDAEFDFLWRFPSPE
ncbi:MAG: hypothetical protein JW741_31285 [Sedimentisphaerales bacterium]|nr:hypothetical protein [Sedimentisphaerales bacterium]